MELTESGTFEAARTRKELNAARCLACHEPESGRGYVFTCDQVAGMGQ